MPKAREATTNDAVLASNCQRCSNREPKASLGIEFRKTIFDNNKSASQNLPVRCLEICTKLLKLAISAFHFDLLEDHRIVLQFTLET